MSITEQKLLKAGRITTLENCIKEMDEKFPLLMKWLDRLNRFGIKDKVLVIGTNEGGMAQLEIFTEKNRYHIQAHLPDHKLPDGYLGCTVSKRAPYPGEDWTRGRDLADGKYAEATFYNILADIVSFELKTIKIADREVGGKITGRTSGAEGIPSI